jgi:hypothetical protein
MSEVQSGVSRPRGRLGEILGRVGNQWCPCGSRLALRRSSPEATPPMKCGWVCSARQPGALRQPVSDRWCKTLTKEKALAE